jgi:hypothetical protein
MYVAMSENRFLTFLPFRLFRVSHSMKCQNMMGRPFVFDGNISSSYSILGGMPFAAHVSLLKQPNVGYRLRP